MGTSLEDLRKIAKAPPRSWVEAIVLLIVRDEALAEGRLAEALNFHRRISDRASSHLGLIGENLARSHWQAAALLSKDPEKAQAAARTLLKHLASTAPSNRSSFERFLFEDPRKWDCLVAFSTARPAVRLWHGRGLFEDLFRWLATLFLVGPDHVLDCERIHARWQWLVATRRAVRLPSLNAILKVTHYLDGHQGVLPPNEDLDPLLQAARQQLQWDLKDLSEDDDVARGWRHQMVFRDRFNVSPEDFNLLQHLEPRRNEPAGDPYKITWRTYCRSILSRGSFFQFSSNTDVVFYVNENKVLAGRQERGEGEAVGRSLVLTFFEAFEGHPGMARRVDRRDESMRPRQMTIAELLQVCGARLPHDPERSSAETEELFEEAFGREDLRRFSGQLETAADELHVYFLTEETNAEEAFVRESSLESLTKIALARFLERVGEGSRKALWQQPLGDLREKAGLLLDPRAEKERRAEAGKGKLKAKAKGKREPQGTAKAKGKAKAKAQVKGKAKPKAKANACRGQFA